MQLNTAIFCLGITLALFTSLVEVQAWSGNVCTKRAVRYVWRTVCVYRWWGSCCRYRRYRVCEYFTQRYCCRGWRHNGDQACTIPICSPGCQNGGTCISPNKCQCPSSFNGYLCGNALCSHIKPCYPGTCADNTDTCTCSAGFGGPSCLDFQSGQDPTLATTTAVMSSVDPRTYMVYYSVSTDATFPDDNGAQTFWTNLIFFNKLNVTFDTLHPQREDLPAFPDYVTDAKFGIVEASVRLEHRKRDGDDYLRLDSERFPCKPELSSDNPETEIVECRIDTGRFVNSLEHEDMLDITVTSENGGYRVLTSLDDGTTTRDAYKGRSDERKMQFMFDFRDPYHCIMNNTCDEPPIQVVGPEIRKDGFTVRWSGWTDPLSGIDRYIWRVFKLQTDRDKNLTEGAGAPVFWQQANGSDAGSASGTYRPDSAGMFSVYLQVSDKANNSRFARTLVLYDPTSQVDINFSPDARLFVASASADVDYQWQTNLTSPVRVSWKNHFGNRFHENNGLLNPVLPFPGKLFVERIGDRDIVDDKRVKDPYDDNHGERTVDPITNIHGMVKFEVAHKTDNVLGTSCTQPPNSWTDVSDPWNEEHVFNPNRQDGTTVCIWVRGFDVFDNTKTDLTFVHFDSSVPDIGEPEVQRNVAPTGEPYHSTIRTRVRDGESGVEEIRWRIIDVADGSEFRRGSVFSRLNSNETCDTLSGNCECSPENTNNCYKLDNDVHLPHCAVNVTKARVLSLVVRVEIEAVNGAGLSSEIKTFELRNLTQLDGINKYVAPMQFKSRDISTSSVTVEWDNPPSCYSLSAIQVAYRPVNDGQLHNTTSFRLNTDVSLNGLYRCTDYVMWIYNIYDTEVSDPSEHTFSTICYTGSEIAGIVIGLLLLLALIALLIFILVLWRRGQLRSTLERRFTRARTILRNRVRRNSQARRTTYFNNMGKDDDLYVYGNMSFDSKQNWALSGSDLDLQEVIAEGRFARVYRATLMMSGTSPRTVAAKMLLPTRSQNGNEILVMKAKLNFMASNDLEHENVIGFVGGINDDVERGPIMLLEYCEMGTLRNWLTNQKKHGKVSEDVVDRLFHIAFGVAKGMEYLASRDIIHRKLAARNVLLDFSLQPKIIGFGPVPDELADEADNSSKGERLPLKWMAPELVKAKSTKNSNEKTDVWSYGVVVWEIFSLGGIPYANIKSSDLFRKLNQGYREKQPEFMTDEYDMLTKRCWNQMPEDRPTFATLVKEQATWFDNSGKHSSYYDSSQLKNYY